MPPRPSDSALDARAGSSTMATRSATPPNGVAPSLNADSIGGPPAFPKLGFTSARVAWVVVPADHIVRPLVATAAGGLVVGAQSESTFRDKNDYVVARLDADGAELARVWGLGSFGAALGGDGSSVVLLSALSGRLRFGAIERTSSDSHSDLFVTRFDAALVATSANRYATPDFDRGDGLATWPDGSLALLHGAFVPPRDGSWTFTVAGGRDTLVTRLDLQGRASWTWSSGLATTDEGSAVAVTPDGDLLVGGTRWLTASNDLPGQEDAPHAPFVAKIAPDGRSRWITVIGRDEDRERLLHLVPLPRAGMAIAGVGRRRPAGRADGFVQVLTDDAAPGPRVTTPELGCLMVLPDGSLLGVGTRGVIGLGAATVPLRAFDPADVTAVTSCVVLGPRSIAVAGLARTGGRVGEVPVPPPRQKRAPSWMSQYEDAFVARIDLAP